MAYSVNFRVDLLHDGNTFQDESEVETVARTKTILIPYGRNPSKFLVKRHGDEFVLHGLDAAYLKRSIQDERIFNVVVSDDTPVVDSEEEAELMFLGLSESPFSLFPIYVDEDYNRIGNLLGAINETYDLFGDLVITVHDDDFYIAANRFDEFNSSFVVVNENLDVLTSYDGYLEINAFAYDGDANFYLSDGSTFYHLDDEGVLSNLTFVSYGGLVLKDSVSFYALNRDNPYLYTLNLDGSVIPSGGEEEYLEITLADATIYGCYSGCFLMGGALYAAMSLDINENSGVFLCEINTTTGVIENVFGKLNDDVNSVSGLAGVVRATTNGDYDDLESHSVYTFPIGSDGFNYNEVVMTFQYSVGVDRYDEAVMTNSEEDGVFYGLGEYDSNKIELFSYDLSEGEKTVMQLPANIKRRNTTSVINDGGNDMYDSGNILNTNRFPGVDYTHTQTSDAGSIPSDGSVGDGSLWFGSGSSYFTNMYPAMFVMVARNIDIKSFNISGELGADNLGFAETDVFTIGSYHCVYKKVHGASEPSVNQLIIVPSSSNSLQVDYSEVTNFDYFKVSGLEGVDRVYYLLFSSTGGRNTSYEEFQAIATAFLGVVDGGGSTINDSLTALNASYSDISDLITDPYIFIDSGSNEVGGIDGLQAMALHESNLYISGYESLYRLAIDGSELEQLGSSNTYYNITCLVVHDGLLYGGGEENNYFYEISLRSGIISNDLNKGYMQIRTIDDEYAEGVHSLASCGGVLYGFVRFDSQIWLVSINPEDGIVVKIREGFPDSGPYSHSLLCGSFVGERNLGLSISGNPIDFVVGYDYSSGRVTASIRNLWFHEIPTTSNMSVQYQINVFDYGGSWTDVDGLEIVAGDDNADGRYTFSFDDPGDVQGDIYVRIGYTGTDFWIYLNWID